MKIKYWAILVCAIGICFMAAPAICQDDDTPKLMDEAFGKHTRPAVPFDHDGHNEKAGLEENCGACHHDDTGKPVSADELEETSCSACHMIKAEGNTVGLMSAYHRQCIKCHQIEKKGPVACGECHVK